MTFWVFAAGFGVVAWVLAGLLWRWFGPPRHATLSYEVPRPTAAMARLGEAFGDAAARMSYGSCSTAEWRRRCEASARASRRRRGLD